MVLLPILYLLIMNNYRDIPYTIMELQFWKGSVSRQMKGLSVSSALSLLLLVFK